MDALRDRFRDIDRNIAANLRTCREAGGISQDEMAQRMTDRGFGFSQATIWKIESGQRPVKASELAALRDSLGHTFSLVDLTSEPEAARHKADLRLANQAAHDAYQTLKKAAAAYIRAQYDLLFIASAAHDAGVTVTELDASWLDTAAEQAVIEARIEDQHEAAQGEQVHEAVGKVLDALRAAGYEPALRIEDVEVHRGGPAPVWTPPQPGEAGAQ